MNKRVVALVLCLTLIIISIPFISSAENLSQQEQQTALTEKLKMAWCQLEEKVTSVAVGNRHSAIPSITSYSKDDLSGLPQTARENISEFIGDRYSVVTLEASTENADTVNAGSNFIRYTPSPVTVDVSGCNVYLSFYMDKLNGSLSFVPYFRGATTQTGLDSGALYQVKNDDVGKWVTIGSEKLKGTGFNNVTTISNDIILFVNSSDVNNIIFGSFVFTKNLSLPKDSENWSVKEWVETINELDLNNYYNTEQLINILNDYELEIAIENVKSAFENLEEKKYSLGIMGAYEKVVPTVIKDKTQLPDDAQLNLPQIKSEDFISAKISTTPIKYNDNEVGSGYLGFGGIEDKPSKYSIYFSFYVTSLTGTLSFRPYFRGENATVNTGKEYVVTEEDVGKWVTLSTEQLVNDNFNNLENMRNRLILGIYSTAPNEVIFSNFVFMKSPELPDNSDSFTAADWVKKSRSMDLSNCRYSEDLLKYTLKLEKFVDGYSSNIEKIYNAWSNMKSKTVELTIDNNASKHRGLKSFVIKNRTDISELPENAINIPEAAGQQYITLSVEKTVDSSDIYGGSFVRFNSIDISTKGSDVYLSFFVEKLNGALSITPFFRETGKDGANTGKEYVITEEDVGKWVTLSTEDLAGPEFYKVNNCRNDLLLRIDSSGDNSIILSDIIFAKNLGKDIDNYLTFTADEWAKAANSFLIENGLDDTNCYGFQEFKNAIDNINYGVSAEYEIGDFTTEIGDFTTDKISSLGNNLLIDKIDTTGAITSKTAFVRINGVQTSGGNYSLLCDGKLNEGYIIAKNVRKEENVTFDIFYDLGGIYKLDGFLFNSAELKFLITGKYEIFVSQTADELFSENRKVISYDNMSDSLIGSTVSQKFTYNAPKELLGKFVCFRITVPVNDWETAADRFPGLLYPRLTELGVYGEKYTLDDTKVSNLAYYKNINLNYYTYDYATKTFTELEWRNNYYASTVRTYKFMCDENPFTVFDIYAGEQGKSSIDIIIDLKDNYLVNSVKLNAASDENHWPSKMNVYIGETSESVKSPTAKPCHIFTEKASDGIYTMSMPATYVRYVRFQITDATHPEMQTHLLAVISEIQVLGIRDHIGSNDLDIGDLNANGEIDVLDLIKLKKISVRAL